MGVNGACVKRACIGGHRFRGGRAMHGLSACTDPPMCSAPCLVGTEELGPRCGGQGGMAGMMLSDPHPALQAGVEEEKERLPQALASPSARVAALSPRRQRQPCPQRRGGPASTPTAYDQELIQSPIISPACQQPEPRTVFS